MGGIGQYGQGAGKGGLGCWDGAFFTVSSVFRGRWAFTAAFSPYHLFLGLKAFLMGFFKTPHKQAPKSTRNYQGSTAVCKGFDVFFSRLVLLVTLRVFLLTLL